MAKDRQSVALAPGTPVRVTNRSGSITVIGEDRADVLIERGADRVTAGSDGVEIQTGSGKVLVRCPTGTDAFVGTGSGKVKLEGSLGITKVTTQSGKISVEYAVAVDARTGSGSIEVLACDGVCRAHTGSGSLRVGRAGSAELVTGSGGVDAEAVGGAMVRTGSGSVSVGLSTPGSVTIEAHSGSVTVAVPFGVHPRFELRANSGSVLCTCEPGNDGVITVSTGSGSIRVTEQ